jgi:hypothetical protein
MNETAKPGDLLVASKTLLTIVLSDNTLVLKDVCLQWCLDLITSKPPILLLSQTFVLHTSRVIVSADDGVRDVP